MDKQVDYYHSPIATLEITMDGHEVEQIKFLPQREAKSIPGSKVMQLLFQELDAYFDGKLTTFSTPVKITGTAFEQQVLKALQAIPYGQTRSYKDIAIQVGNVKSVRAVGRANGGNKIPILIPCHRVIGEDGSLTGFTGGLKTKSWLLTHEGALAKQLAAF